MRGLLLYCPVQASMGVSSSNAKNWGWALTRKRWLNNPTMLVQVPTPGSKFYGGTLPVFSRSTNLESKLIEFCVFVNF